jgi:hypothetical protein
MQKFYFSFWGSLELLLSAKNCKLGILVSPPVWKMKSKVRMKIVLHMKRKRRGEERRFAQTLFLT